MLTLTIGELCLFLILLAIPGGIVGYVVANYRQRAACGGKTPAELKEELSSYKGDVTEHFRMTASLLQHMTDQYRAVYEHLADGAQRLCEPDEAVPSLADLRAGLLVESHTPGEERQVQLAVDRTRGGDGRAGAGKPHEHADEASPAAHESGSGAAPTQAAPNAASSGTGSKTNPRDRSRG